MIMRHQRSRDKISNIFYLAEMEDSMLCYREPADPRTYGMDLFDSGPDES